MALRAAYSDSDTDKAKRYIYVAITRIDQDQTLIEDAKPSQIEKIWILLNIFY
jgi:hypothetical protein